MQRMNSWLVRVLLGTCIALVLSLLAGGTAGAHAHLKSSTPADGATLTSAPATISAVYEEETSLTSSKFELYYAKSSSDTQTLIASGKVDVNDRTKMSVTLPAGSGDGSYTVKWQTVTEDDNGQATGSFSFTVGTLLTSSTSGSGSTSNSGTMTTSSGTSTLPQTGNPAPGLAWPAVLGVLVLGGGLALRRRSA